MKLELECSERDGARERHDRGIGATLMLRFETDLKVFLHREPIDIRAYAKLATMLSFCNDDRRPLVFPALRGK